VLFTCADAGAEHRHELGANFRYDDEHVVRFPRLLPFFGACFDLVDSCSVSLGARLPASITDYDEHRHTLEHLLDNNTYMPRAVDRSLPVDVSYLHLSSHGLCLADSVLSQRSPSPRLRLFRCATSPAMSLPLLTVVSHSHRRPRIPPRRHTRLYYHLSSR
jgi:hypothetical protein